MWVQVGNMTVKSPSLATENGEVTRVLDAHMQNGLSRGNTDIDNMVQGSLQRDNSLTRTAG